MLSCKTYLSVLLLLSLESVSAGPLRLRRTIGDGADGDMEPTSEAAPRPSIRGDVFEKIIGVVGENERLPCDVKDAGNAWIHWFKDDRRIDTKDNQATGPNAYRIDRQRYVVTNSGLTIKKIKKSSEGTYRCEVESDNGFIVKKTIIFEVDGEPIYMADEDVGMLRWMNPDLRSDQPMFTVQGRTLTLDCSVKGEQSINISWLWDNMPIQPNDERIKWSKNQEIKYRSSQYVSATSMVIKPVFEDNDENKFSCIVNQTLENGTSSTLRRDFLLMVEEREFPLTIVNDNEEAVVAYIGQDFEYECRLLKPELQDQLVLFSWYKVFENKTKNDYQLDLDWLHSRNNTAQPLLQIKNVQLEDSGKYACIARNQDEEDFKIFDIEVQSTPVKGTSKLRPYDENQNWMPLAFGIGISVFIVFFIVITVSIVMCLQRRKPEKRQKKRIIYLQSNQEYNGLMKDSNSDFDTPLMPPTIHIAGRNRLSSEITSYSDYEFPLDEVWEIQPRNRLDLMHLLGEGNFGCVYYGELNPTTNDDCQTVQAVAVKMLRTDATNKELMDLVQELEVMKRFGKHKNVINLMGCMTRDGPFYVVVEYARHGNLKDFLRTHRPMNSFGSRIIQQNSDDLQLTHKHLVSFAHQVAVGMKYLASKQCLHRDLAARNVLVADDYVIKIADFGLSRNIAQSDYYKKVTEGKLPIKWMAPETLIDRKYTTKSDVWSYGVLLWEIYTLGGNPYPTVAHERLFEALKEGHRMDRPSYSSGELYAIMRQCWQQHPVQRPSFSDLVDELEQILSSTSDDDYLDLTCSTYTSTCTSTTSCESDQSKQSTDVLPPPPPVLV